jgi:hypothetical protein
MHSGSRGTARRPETLSDAEVQQILDACDRVGVRTVPQGIPVRVRRGGDRGDDRADPQVRLWRQAMLRQMPGCCVHSRCIRVQHDAARATKKTQRRGRCHHRPVVTLTPARLSGSRRDPRPCTCRTPSVADGGQTPLPWPLSRSVTDSVSTAGDEFARILPADSGAGCSRVVRSVTPESVPGTANSRAEARRARPMGVAASTYGCTYICQGVCSAPCQQKSRSSK